MNEDLPPNLRPSGVASEDNQQLVEEVVSSVQPHRSRFNRRIVERGLIVVFVILVLGYVVVAGRSVLQLQTKVANAPEDVIASLQMPVHTDTVTVPTSLPLPAVVENPYQPQLVQPPAVIDETPPIPRISSTFTDEPSIATKPKLPAKVAGASTQVTPAYTYTSPHGFSFRVPAGCTVQEVEQGRLVVLSAKGQVLSEVTILPQSNTQINGIPAELALSSNISNIRTGVLGADPAFLYTVNTTAQGARISNGASTYYITDYFGKVLPTFTLR